MNIADIATTGDVGNRTAPTKSKQHVVFSEVPLWIAFSFAFFISISETIFGLPLRNALVLKHIPLLIFLPAFALYIVGRTINGAPRLDSNGWGSWLWPFLLLGIFAALGSLYARFVLDVRETFLVLGLYLLLTPLFFLWGRDVGNTNKVVKPFLVLWGISSCVAVAGSIAYLGKGAVLHNIEFLVQPFFLYLFFAQKRVAGKLVAIMLLAFATALTQKLTGYINGMSALCYIGAIFADTHVSPKWKSAVRVSSALVLLATVALTVFGFFYFRDYLPSGNMDVRLHQYEIALAAFRESPIWGQAYTAASGEAYVEYTRSLNIPTHSDILDLLKQGGVIAFLLWVIGVSKSLRLFVRCAKNSLKAGAYFHAMAFLTISTALSCAVNPLFLTPTDAFIIWGSLALAVGVATDTRKGQFNES